MPQIRLMAIKSMYLGIAEINLDRAATVSDGALSSISHNCDCSVAINSRFLVFTAAASPLVRHCRKSKQLASVA